MAHILIVEDTSELRELLAFALSRSGHHVDCAENGRAGLERLRAGGPDLVVTDIMMPEMDGISLIRAGAEEFPDVPFIAMSGGLALSPAYLEMAAECGAVACLEKPFAMATLERAIDAALRERAEAVAPAIAAAG